MAGGDGDQTTGGKPAPKQAGGATDKQNAYKVTRVFLKVLVRTDFLAKAPFLINASAAGGQEFHWDGGEAVAHATVTLPGADPVETDRGGVAKLDITNVADGNYNVTIDMLTPVTARTDAAAGPDLGRGLASMPSRIYRPLVVPITLLDKKLKNAVDPYNADTGATWGRVGNSTQAKISDTLLPIDWRPVWMKSPGEGAVRNGTDVTLIVCHNTSGPKLGSTISTFTSGGSGGDSAHYVIEHDGHVIKFCREDHVVNHAGHAPGDTVGGVVWGGRREVNSISVGIEMVHEEKPNVEAGIAYHDQQVKALIGLLQALQADATLAIATHRVVGHADVDFSFNGGGPASGGSLGSRDMDPGQVFVWETVEAAGVGMIPQAEPDMSKAYGGFFTQVPGGSLRQGDNDTAKRWGGDVRKAYDEKTGKGMPIPDSQAPIQELQEDLSHIGYTANQDGLTSSDKANVSDKAGEYHDFTTFQVRKFQWHFFSGSRRRKKDGKLIKESGQVDLETAKMIKRVRAGVP